MWNYSNRFSSSVLIATCSPLNLISHLCFCSSPSYLLDINSWILLMPEMEYICLLTPYSVVLHPKPQDSSTGMSLKYCKYARSKTELTSTASILFLLFYTWIWFYWIFLCQPHQHLGPILNVSYSQQSYLIDFHDLQMLLLKYLLHLLFLFLRSPLAIEDQ